LPTVSIGFHPAGDDSEAGRMAFMESPMKLDDTLRQPVSEEKAWKASMLLRRGELYCPVSPRFSCQPVKKGLYRSYWSGIDKNKMNLNAKK
jgi:hypothetical protein